MRIGEALMAAQKRIAVISDSPRLDAELLLGQVTGLGRAQLLVRLDQLLPRHEAECFDALVQRRARGEPVAYLTGDKEFWTLNLKVTPAVLIPRPETELLVEWGLQLIAGCKAPRIADLGTGSGALALALASERPDAQVEATEFSAAALAVAQENAQRLLPGRVRFHAGHWLAPLTRQTYDLIVSNPPYIAHDDPHLQTLTYEPAIALTDGADGLNALREIIAGAPAYLVAGGWLLVEHGYEQGPAVRALFAQAGFDGVTTRCDYGGRERATAGRFLRHGTSA